MSMQTLFIINAIICVLKMLNSAWMPAEKGNYLTMVLTGWLLNGATVWFMVWLGVRIFKG